MKKLFFIITFALITAIFSSSMNAQSNSEKALVLTGGFSQITGFGGIEYYNGFASLDFGIGVLRAPYSGETNTTVGAALSFYSAQESQPSTYLSFGYTLGGVVYDVKSNFGYNNTEFEDSFTIMGGYRFAAYGRLSLKAGFGYMWASDLKGWTYEAKLGFRIWNN